MAHKRLVSGKWEFTVKRAGLLEKPLILRFDTEAEGDAYCARVEAQLDQKIVPAQHEAPERLRTVLDLVNKYEREAHPSRKDQQILGSVLTKKGTTPLPSLTVNWVDQWLRELKTVDKLAPDTISKKIGALARCCDWAVRKGLLAMPDHPFRTLPNGYAQYNATEAKLAGVKRVNVERDRRLEDGEFEAILKVLDGGVLPRKQRPLVLQYVPALRCLITLAPETAMRQREMYTLTLDQVDLKRRTVFLDKTKNGNKRQVPLSTVAVEAIKVYLRQRETPEGYLPELLFPWWSGDGSPAVLDRVSDDLSDLLKKIFETAGCMDLGIHDLRHEATSRLFERTKFGDTQIMLITGHSSIRMLKRYANLRASTLSAGLW